MGYYRKLGFTGAMGSTDVTHIRWDRCAFSLLRSSTGKEVYPSIAYQVTVDHTGHALAVTTGFAGAHNDETIIRYDAAVKRIREDPVYTEQPFELKGKDGEVISCKGLFMLVDNGYHRVREKLRFFFKSCLCRRKADMLFHTPEVSLYGTMVVSLVTRMPHRLEVLFVVAVLADKAAGVPWWCVMCMLS